MIKIALAVLAVALLSWVVVAAVIRYRQTEGDAILTAFRNSATIALAEAMKVLGAAMEIIAVYGDMFSDPAVPNLLTSIGIPPNTVGILMAGIGFAVSIARKRTLA